MAIIDVTDHGVTFNDRSAAADNAAALERILRTQADDGDTIEFPFTPGDRFWVGHG